MQMSWTEWWLFRNLALLYCSVKDWMLLAVRPSVHSPQGYLVLRQTGRREAHTGKAAAFPSGGMSMFVKHPPGIYQTLLRNLGRRQHPNSTRRNEWQTQLLKTMWEGLRNVLPFKIYRLQMRAVCLKTWLPRNVRAVSVDKKGPFWGEKMPCPGGSTEESLVLSETFYSVYSEYVHFYGTCQ